MLVFTFPRYFNSLVPNPFFAFLLQYQLFLFLLNLNKFNISLNVTWYFCKYHVCQTIARRKYIPMSETFGFIVLYKEVKIHREIARIMNRSNEALKSTLKPHTIKMNNIERIRVKEDGKDDLWNMQQAETPKSYSRLL